jgi:hypothetical protein
VDSTPVTADSAVAAPATEPIPAADSTPLAAASATPTPATDPAAPVEDIAGHSRERHADTGDGAGRCSRIRRRSRRRTRHRRPQQVPTAAVDATPVTAPNAFPAPAAVASALVDSTPVTAAVAATPVGTSSAMSVGDDWPGRRKMSVTCPPAC